MSNQSLEASPREWRPSDQFDHYEVVRYLSTAGTPNFVAKPEFWKDAERRTQRDPVYWERQTNGRFVPVDMTNKPLDSTCPRCGLVGAGTKHQLYCEGALDLEPPPLMPAIDPILATCSASPIVVLAQSVVDSWIKEPSTMISWVLDNLIPHPAELRAEILAEARRIAAKEHNYHGA